MLKVCNVKAQEWPDPFCEKRVINLLVKDQVSHKTIGILKAQPDSAAQANVLGFSNLGKIGIRPKDMVKKADILTAANNLPLDVSGRICLHIQVNKKILPVTFIVTEDSHDVLLNRKTSIELGLIKEIGENAILSETCNQQFINSNSVKGCHPQASTIRTQLLKEFSDVFKTNDDYLEPMEGGAMKISLKEGAVPYHIPGSRPVPLAIRDEVKLMLDNKENRGIISRVTEPRSWCHPMVVTRKKNGKPRLCIDTRKLNEYVNRPNHPTRNSKDIIQALAAGSKYFSTFDAKDGYFQIELDEDSRKLVLIYFYIITTLLLQ